MKADRYLKVLYQGRLAGTLALTPEKKAAFEYADEWLKDGFSISPFSLPLKKQVFVPQKDYFHGLFGVFADSLPDAWGNILLNRLLKKKGINADQMDILDRLAIVGSSGMGALTYQPEIQVAEEGSGLDLDYLSEQCQSILETEYTEELDRLYHLGGTSGGARPKIMTKIGEEDWIIKFPARHIDGEESGLMEYEYAKCAAACKIQMPETKLFPSQKCRGYFGTKRFDRVRADGAGETKKIHMLTATALLELDFEQPSLDYHSLMKLTKILTRNNQEDMQNMFRRMCFNVFAHNRDDHSKNFSFLYDEEKDCWRLSPAYDLTYSTTYYGEHTTTVDGEGASPGIREILAVGTAAGLGKRYCEAAAQEILEKVKQMLGRYLSCGWL